MVQASFTILGCMFNVCWSQGKLTNCFAVFTVKYPCVGNFGMALPKEGFGINFTMAFGAGSFI